MLLNRRYLPPPQTPVRCQNCQDLNLRDPKIKGILGIPLEALRISSDLGCPCCHVLVRALDLPDLQPPAGDSLFGVTLLAHNASVDDYSEEPSRPLIMRLQTEYRHYAEVEIFTEEGHPSPWPVIGHARVINVDAGSEACMKLIRSWILDCLTKHPKCSTSTTALLPDRVLDVRKGRNPVLHINKGNEQGTYAALSHCWGGDVALKLTGDNIGGLISGVAIESLPKTFQHTVEVCRLLDIPYLWIDSLCIIQTSKADWDVQGSKMDAVYSLAFVVIAADGAHNSTEGFLRNSKRQLPTLKVPCFSVTSTSSNMSERGQGHEMHVYARKKGVGNLDVFHHHSRMEEYRSNLSTRGWVLQESILAKRILHFTAEEVTWECKVISRCECQVALHSHKYEVPVRQRLQSPLNRTVDWPHLVHDFSCRNLTYATDRLPAMSGLAASMQPLGSTVVYYAGLWSDSLPQSLFWFCVPHTPDLSVSLRSSKRVSPPCAPTWSWASITGRVVFTQGTSGEQNLRDIRVSCPPSGKNRYGAVAGATLTTRANILRGKVFRDTDAKAEEEFQVQLFQKGATGEELLPPTGGTFLDIVGDGNLEIQDGDDVVIVDQIDAISAGSGIHSFLLLKAEMGTQGIYRRVGFFLCESPSNSCLGVCQTITIV